MFSTENRYQSRKILFDKLIELQVDENEDERLKLKEAEEVILSGSMMQRFELAREVLVDFNNVGKVLRFYFNSPIFQEFCQKNEFLHKDNWIEVLEILGYPGEDIVSVNQDPEQKEVISILDQYFAAHCLSEYLSFMEGEKEMDPALGRFYLDVACEFGLFNALVVRCELNQAKIKNPQALDRERTDALTQVELDGKRLGNLYWGVGYLHAALVFLDIGNYLANQNNEDTALIAHTFQKSAVKSFTQGKELCLFKALPQNERIIKTICGKNGLEVFEFRDWDSAQTFFLSHLNPDLGPYEDFISDARTEIRENIYAKRSKA